MKPHRLFIRLRAGLANHGAKWLIGKLVLIAGMVVLTPLAVILRMLGYRFVDVTTDRIGHLITEPDALIKEALLGWRPKFCAIVCAPRGRMANTEIPSLFKAYREQVLFVTEPVLCFLMKPLLRHPVLLYRVARYLVAFDHQAGYIPIVEAWQGRPPVAQLPEHIQRAGIDFLRNVGILDDAWFVCVHSREGGYSPGDEHLHDYRNSEIESYMGAVDEIVARGGWVIRIGDPSMRPMPSHERAIDYAHYAGRNPALDLFIFARSHFFLGNTSGPFLAAGAFGVPVALANLAPMSMTCTYGENDLGIPKRIYSNNEGRELKFAEILGSDVGNWRFAELFEAANLRHIDNTSEEIRELAIEMLDRLSGQLRYSPEDEALQSDFRSLLRPVHYTYGSKTRIGRDFLMRHKDLLN